MKLLSYMTLSALLTISSCSHGHKAKSCCGSKPAAACSTEDCKKACCDKDKKCSDGSCAPTAKTCEGESCKKKS
ncbi:MAG: hypothetical protein H0V66_02980 [Bdellovibrionales bacterium]|nr:hypothetical protein [Bdellovibrionales bacterium]